ncbi:MAG: glycosyltransferase [Desulfovibrio sp.]|nr:glycosyltransferase [Desulfovibrio sp.]
MVAQQIASPRCLPTPLLGCAACLAAMAHLGRIGPNAPAMAALWGAAFALLIVFYTGAIRQDGPRLFWPILALGLMLRALFFLQTDAAPHLSRAAWEGWLQLQGFNPYAQPPAHAALEAMRGGPMAAVWPLITHNDAAATSPPLTQLVFRLAAACSPTIMAAKAAVLAFELLALACVAWLAKVREAPDAALALYALNPLVLYFVAGEGRLDAIMVGCVAAGLVSFHVDRPGRDRLGFLLLGLAGMAQPLAWSLLPFFITRSTLPRLWWAALPLVLWAPFLDAGPALLASVLQAGHQPPMFDGILYRLLQPAAATLTPLVLAAGLLLCLAGIWLSVQERLRAVFLASLTVLVWLPSLPPWSLLLPAVLLPLFPSRTAVAFMTVQVCAVAFPEHAWLRDVSALPVLALLLRALWRSDALQPTRHAPPASLNVIIPTLNEADRLRQCLESLRTAMRTLQDWLTSQRPDRPMTVEILVADGGSYDDTLDVARETRCLVIHAPRGRGRQIAAATHVATGDVLLFLHAELTMHPDALVHLVQALDARPDAVHGALGLRFARQEDEWWVIALCHALRARCTEICVGDQAQWIRRATLDQAGGFPALWLMEDVELSLRAKELGPAHIRPWNRAGVTVSTRAWSRKGLGPGARAALQVFFRYLVERRLGLVQARDPEARHYFEQFYGRAARDPWEVAEDAARETGRELDFDPDWSVRDSSHPWELRWDMDREPGEDGGTDAPAGRAGW